jgi:hypothetical protein
MDQPGELLVCTQNLGNCPVDRLASPFKFSEGPSECEVMSVFSRSALPPPPAPERTLTR